MKQANHHQVTLHANALHSVSRFFAADPIEDVTESRSIRPDLERPSMRDYWQDKLDNRERHKQKKKQNPEGKRPATNHRIDDFA